ncbi:hypothetical protein Poly51_28750 [Rubripirellula tenax]|uniref:Secreted protein n=2 Tax=Rubripirellula tenax TaxID=2528015 RepID=A0A5C6F9W9_9BACT|nr:hypothetical protein Poly51_28750 [Rubripirellula tenax]
MRLAHTSMFLVLLFVPVIGCGDGGANTTLETSDMQAYIDAHPEMAEKQKARQATFEKPGAAK